jgi:hypothetical protein
MSSAIFDRNVMPKCNSYNTYRNTQRPLEHKTSNPLQVSQREIEPNHTGPQTEVASQMQALDVPPPPVMMVAPRGSSHRAYGHSTGKIEQTEVANPLPALDVLPSPVVMSAPRSVSHRAYSRSVDEQLVRDQRQFAAHNLASFLEGEGSSQFTRQRQRHIQQLFQDLSRYMQR